MDPYTPRRGDVISLESTLMVFYLEGSTLPGRFLTWETFLVLEADKKPTLEMRERVVGALNKKSIVTALLSTGERGTISFLNSDVKLIHRNDEDNGNTKS